MQQLKTEAHQEKGWVEVLEDEELGELTADEERDRLVLERKVERAFYEAGKALQEIRDRRLYRNTHKTFEEYCAGSFLLSESLEWRIYRQGRES